jgi:hypothetical protein
METIEWKESARCTNFFFVGCCFWIFLLLALPHKRVSHVHKLAFSLALCKEYSVATHIKQRSQQVSRKKRRCLDRTKTVEFLPFLSSSSSYSYIAFHHLPSLPHFIVVCSTHSRVKIEFFSHMWILCCVSDEPREKFVQFNFIFLSRLHLHNSFSSNAISCDLQMHKLFLFFLIFVFMQQTFYYIYRKRKLWTESEREMIQKIHQDPRETER